VPALIKVFIHQVMFHARRPVRVKMKQEYRFDPERAIYAGNSILEGKEDFYIQNIAADGFSRIDPGCSAGRGCPVDRLAG
jgi:hypothetical protein